MSETPERPPQTAAECEALVRPLPGAAAVEHRSDGLWMTAPGLDVLAMAELMRRAEARLSTITGFAVADGETAIIYHYCLGPWPINIRTVTRARAIPSITPVTRTADWSEREIADLYGVSFIGHPNPGRLLRPPPLPAGFFRDPKGRDGGPERAPSLWCPG